MFKHLTLAATLVLSTLAGAPAQAQLTSQALAKVKNEAMLIRAFGMTVDKLKDVEVVDNDGETIGTVSNLLYTRDGTYADLTVDVRRYGYIRNKEIMVPLQALIPGGDRFVLDLSEEELEKLPVW